MVDDKMVGIRDECCVSPDGAFSPHRACELIYEARKDLAAALAAMTSIQSDVIKRNEASARAVERINQLEREMTHLMLSGGPGNG